MEEAGAAPQGTTEARLLESNEQRQLQSKLQGVAVRVLDQLLKQAVGSAGALAAARRVSVGRVCCTGSRVLQISISCCRLSLIGGAQ